MAQGLRAEPERLATLFRVLKHRMLLGPLLIVALIGVIVGEEYLRSAGRSPGWLLIPTMLLIGAEAARELAKVFRARKIATSTRLLTLSVWSGLLASSFTPAELGSHSGAAIVSSAAAGVLLAAMIFYSRHHSAEGVVSATAATLLAFVYVGLLGGFLVIFMKEFTGWVLLAVVLTTKSCDIGAYFTGTTIGRHKLIPWLSPGKTWEGLAGGLALAAAVGTVAAALSRSMEAPIQLELWEGALLGALFGLVGQAGDLVASMLKRDAGMKDYSRALPGFGGVLDIADSPLLVAPVAYWMFRLMATAAPGLTAQAPMPSG
jgi:phosphatidate cytidylyltransferase